ncbi:PREDICTED: pentatricopeptide repeat-containing protein At1g01970 [Nicotiana attenuata]|uniref:Pentatricopeptide repeat-containing protein n=1 Tax=Nicotiana attenuata TaxID=49451 RepID=A0A314KUR1_NICAT|nr:PREDICTED: pentatricopeptide repeat-containing protein At1g01970 [Nicotiana attenuata]OIT33241.1 pentatricopeptide repeat-containing protein [Nicotiana attenuata]
MSFTVYGVFSRSTQTSPLSNTIRRIHQYPLNGVFSLQKVTIFGYRELGFKPLLAVSNVAVEKGSAENQANDKPRYKWVKIGSDITEEQKQAILKLPPKMTNRCKALMLQIICYSPEKGSVSLLLEAWVKSMKPERADWLEVLKELDRLNHPLYFEVAEVSLLEESFEANVRDYTKIIHGYAKQNRLREAESMLLAMKTRGFTCDQVVLTALVHMYSKAGKLKMAEDTFEEMRLLGVTLDKRSYGSMIMAYVRAGMLGEGEALLKEMEEQEIYAGREVYKAILRAYSMIGDSKGAQRVFDALQLAGIIPDATVCGLLMNAYVVAGQLSEACIAFENLRRAGIEPNDKCIALLLSAYETENNLSKALDVLMNLERDGVVLGREASEILARWFKKLGVVGEVELVLREFMHQT